MAKKLTKKQEVYIDEKMHGRDPSVILGDVRSCDRSESTQVALREQQDQLAQEVNITRADVVQGFLDAINRAKLQAEPATEIAGWKEIGKLLGHYAPEIKKVQLTDGQETILRKLEGMSTAELLSLAQRKRELVINGEAQRVPE